MRHLKYIFTAAIAAALAFASCTKEIEAPDETGQEEESYSRETGAPVVFGAATGYDNGPSTKLEYSGVTIDGYERINWELDDRLEILCPQALDPNQKAEYKISGLPSNTGNESKAPIEKAGATGLLWGESIEHTFFGVYPKPTGAGNSLKNKVISTKISDSKIKIEAVVPNVQGIQNEPIMTARTKVNRNDNTPITLNFNPSVNTFDLHITNGLPYDINLTSIELYSPLTKISGPYVIIQDANGRDYEFAKNRSLQKKSVKYVYDSPLFLGVGETAKVRLYTLPKKIGELTLVLNFLEGSTNLEFKRRRYNSWLWIGFEKERKYNFEIEVLSVIHPVSEYIFDVDSPDTLIFAPIGSKYPYVSSAKPLSREVKVKSFGIFPTITSQPVPVVWGCSKEYPWVAYENSRHVYSGGNLWETLKIRCIGPHQGELDTAKFWGMLRKVNLINEQPALEDWNLARGINGPTTANCYNVERRGTYKFPLVYGNAFKNGRINTGAFTPLSRPDGISSDSWLSSFTDGTGRVIDSPFITDAASVELIWSTSTGIRSSKPKNLRLEDGWVKFSMDRFGYGNHLIAVKNSSGQILWTWHIWCTPDVKFSNGFMNQPLGALPGHGGHKEFIEQVEVNQLDAKGRSSTFPVKIKRELEAESCLYYTNGRMTPSLSILNSYYIHNNKKITTFRSLHNKNDGNFIFDYKNESQNSLLNPIAEPGKIYQLRSINRIPINIWNRNPYGNPVKTVYDPCPAGYRVPTLSELGNADLSGFKLGRLSRPFKQNDELNIPITEYLERAYFLNTVNYNSYPAGGSVSDGFIYMPILPKKE